MEGNILALQEKRKDSVNKRTFNKWEFKEEFEILKTDDDGGIIKLRCKICAVHLKDVIIEAERRSLKGAAIRGIRKMAGGIDFIHKGNLFRHIKPGGLHDWAKIKFGYECVFYTRPGPPISSGDDVWQTNGTLQTQYTEEPKPETAANKNSLQNYMVIKPLNPCDNIKSEPTDMEIGVYSSAITGDIHEQTANVDSVEGSNTENSTQLMNDESQLVTQCIHPCEPSPTTTLASHSNESTPSHTGAVRKPKKNSHDHITEQFLGTINTYISEQINHLETTRLQETPTITFARHIANELDGIKNVRKRKAVQFKIHQLLFEAHMEEDNSNESN